jgi:putative endonuclease
MELRRTLGQQGEQAAARFLLRQRFEIIARNLRSRLGELDILAREGSTLVFIEVKARRVGAPDPPEAGVHARKRARLSRLALGYLAARQLGERRCRFDVVAVTLGEDGTTVALRHLRGAFDIDGWAG